MTSGAGVSNRISAAVASLGLAPLTETIFARSGWLPLTACVAVRALLHPDSLALVSVSRSGGEKVWSWAEFDSAIDVSAAWLADGGAGSGTRVAIALPSGASHIIAVQAAWRLGATVAPIDPALPAALRAELLERVDAVTVIDDWPATLPTRAPRARFRLADPHSVLVTGGTLGEPRLAVQAGSLWGRLDGPPDRLRYSYGLADRQTQLITLPLHHGFGHSYAHQYGLAYGHCLVVQEHFDAEVSLRLIERWRVEFLATVPTALGRMARSTAFATADLSGVEALLHGAAPCPVPVKQAWMNRLGPQRVFEAYGATEVSIDCTIRGDEWLHRPGSVGRPFGCAIEIRAETGATQPTGEIGEIFVRPVDPRAAHPNIVGALAWASREARPTGDVGFVDNDGYLYVAGRSALQLVSGGITVHVEAVEATLTAHPEVRDAAVIAVQDDDLGEVPLALVCMEDLALAGPDDLLTWCRSRLASAQVPRSVQIVADLPHTPVGKLDRVRLRAMRTGSA